MPARWTANGFAGRVGGESGIGEGIVAIVGEGCVFNAKGVVEAKVGERVAYLVEAFYADRGDELVVGFKIGQSVTAVELGRRENFRVVLCEAAEEIELGECHGYSCVF